MSASDDGATLEHVELFLTLGPIKATIRRPSQQFRPITAVLTIGGSLNMPAQISIDDQTRKAQVFWVDDKGDTDAPRPDGAVVTFSVDNTAVANITPDPSNPDAGDIAPVAEGTANVNVGFTDPNGNALMEPDGVTPFSVPPAPFQVVAGQAVGAGLSIQST